MRKGILILVLAALATGSSPVIAGPAAPAPAPAAARPAPAAAHPTPPPPPTLGRTDTGGTATGAAPVLSQDAAARSRMHECGHQWSAMKKAGTAGTLTWKEFSATCLVVSR